MNRFCHYLGFAFALIGLLTLGAGDAAAQSPDWAFPSHVLSEGELRNVYHYGGAKPHVGGCHGLNYPAWYRYTCNQTGQGLWLAAMNFTDPSGTEWTHKVAHIGYRNTGAGEFFPTDNQEIVSNKERPQVFVDGLDSFNDPIVYNSVESDMTAAARVTTETTAINGLTMERRIWAFSQEYHDNYHIIEYTITNTGDQPGTQTIALTVDGIQRDSQSLTLNASESQAITLEDRKSVV